MKVRHFSTAPALSRETLAGRKLQFNSFRSFAGTTRVDREKGIIYGVSLISLGEAKGHDMNVDDTTLQQVCDCAKTYKSGLRVSFNPETFRHGPGGVPGFIDGDSLRVENGSVLGDMHVLKSYPHKDYLFDLAERQSDTFGLSIEFSGPDEEIDGIKFARCVEIYAVAVVDEPAANDRGLFSFRATDDPEPANTKQNTKTMPLDDNDMSKLGKMFGEAVKPLSDRIDNLEKTNNERFQKLETRFAESDDDKTPNCTGMSAESIANERRLAGVVDGDSDIIANRKVNTYRKAGSQSVTLGQLRDALSAHSMEVKTMLGNPAAGASVAGGGSGGGSASKSATDIFNEKVDAELKAGKFKGDRSKAMAFCAQQFPAEYKAFAAERASGVGRTMAKTGGNN